MWSVQQLRSGRSVSAEWQVPVITCRQKGRSERMNKKETFRFLHNLTLIFGLAIWFAWSWLVFSFPSFMFSSPGLPTDYYVAFVMSATLLLLFIYMIRPKPPRKWLGIVTLTLGLSGVLVLLFGQLIPQYFGWIPTTSWTPQTLAIGIIGLAGFSVWLSVELRRLAGSIRNKTEAHSH